MAENTDSNQNPRQSVTRPRIYPTLQRSTGQLSGVQIMFAVILAVGLLLAINFSSRIADSQTLFNAYDKVIQEKQKLDEEHAVLLTESAYVQSDAYVEQWARDRGKMIHPGEKLIIPVPAGIVTTPTAIPETVDQQFEDGIPEPESWQLWWSLFFDSPPPEFSNP
jgi:cell division protein FtsL